MWGKGGLRPQTSERSVDYELETGYGSWLQAQAKVREADTSHEPLF